MVTQVQLGDIEVNVVRKDIKNVHLSVHPPTGRVRISAPSHMSIETIRLFAISKVGWIRQQQRKFREQDRETPREYIDRESHYVWGRRYLLVVSEKEQRPSVELDHNRMILQVRPGASWEKRQAIMDDWYREQVKEAAPPLFAKWEPLIGVKVRRLFVQRMKTKWGSCNPDTRTIRLNTDLAKKPPECLEYIVVHEMVHLRERRHGDRFAGLMERFLPRWQLYREELNRAPLGHQNWEY